MSRHLHPRRLLLIASGLLLALLWASTGNTLAAWNSASITNNTNTAKTGTGTMSFTHTYSSPTTTCVGTSGTSSVNCTKAITNTSVPATGSSGFLDNIQNTGSSAAANMSLSVPTCGAVKLANAKGSDANPLLVRRGFTFNPTTGPKTGMGSVAVNGLNTSDVVSTNATSAKGVTWAPPTAADQTGVGIWIRSPANTNRGVVWTLADDAVTRGKERLGLTVRQDRGLFVTHTNTGIGINSDTTPLADGAWHFVYVTFGPTSIGLYVDGSQVTGFSDGSVTGGYAATSGTRYWRLSNGGDYTSGEVGINTFSGSLSNMVVFRGTLPALPTATNLASQAAFDTWATNAAQHWKMNDSGITTHTAAVDWIGAGLGACTQTTMAWSTTNPTGSVAAKTLAAWSTAASLMGPGPSATTGSTLTLARIASGFDTDAQGLWLYAPLQISCGGGSWAQTFRWPDASAKILIS